jgi:glycosyltransferase involved in cell wall biosynthesis
MSKLKNILIVSYYYYPEIGAASSRITNLARGLCNRGYNIHILTCLPNYPKGEIFEEYKSFNKLHEKIDNIDIFRYWTYASISKSPIKRVWGMTSFAINMWQFGLKKTQIEKYDNIIIQSPPILVAFSAILLFKYFYKKKIILNISDLWPSSAVELKAIKQNSIIHKIILSIESFIYKKADKIVNQGEEIINHVKTIEKNKDFFLYRNLQPCDFLCIMPKNKNKKLKIVYAGLFGIAQDILSLIKNIDFLDLDIEFHLYGEGNQKKEIEKYISSKRTNIFYHGAFPKEQMTKILLEYDFSIIPLTIQIKGAVPSKIFDISPLGIPILFCGGGEGAMIVEKYNLGLVSPPGDFLSIKENMIKLKEMTNIEYEKMSLNCMEISSTLFNFDVQLYNFISFIES